MKKIIFTVIAVIIFLLVIVINFSEINTRYECQGNFTRNEEVKETTIYLKLVDYRWWVSLWKKQNHDAVIWIEIPNTFYMVYHNIGKADDVYLIYENNQRQHGRFSTLSKNLYLKYLEGTFNGECKEIK